MPFPPSPPLPLTTRQRKLLTHYSSRSTVPVRDLKRISIVLNGADGMANTQSAKAIGIGIRAVETWRLRWMGIYDQAVLFEEGLNKQGVSDTELLRYLVSVLQDAPRPGTPKKITVEQEQQIVAMACEKPTKYGHEVSVWTHELLAKTVVHEQVASEISASTVRTILKKKNSVRITRNTGFTHVSTTGTTSL